MVGISLVLCLAGCDAVSPGQTSTSTTTRAMSSSGPVGASIASAAAEAGVPPDLLMAVAIEEQGVRLPTTRRFSPDDNVSIGGRLELRHGRLDTLAMGARLMGVTEAELQSDTDLGTRAGALVLAELGTQVGAGSDLESWRPALEALSGMDDESAHNYASRVLAILRGGGNFPAMAGETVHLGAHAEINKAETIEQVRASAATPDYPGAIWTPTSCSNKCTVGRPLGNGSVNKIVIHDTEGGWDASLSTLQNKSGVSVHYLVDADGSRVAQFRSENDTTWHAGNYYYNETSVGIEHVGFVSDPGYQTGLYATSKNLVESIRSRHDVPLDRTHIVGHYQIPNPNILGQQAAPCTGTLDACETSPNYGGASRHTDPGYHWQWCQYMESLGGSCTCNDAWSLWNCTTDGAEAWRCNNGTVEKQDCGGGCDVMPVGTDDVCHVESQTDGPDAGTGVTDPGGPDAGTGATDPGGSNHDHDPGNNLDGGCAVAAGGHGAGDSAWLILGALGLVVLRRRRRSA